MSADRRQQQQQQQLEAIRRQLEALAFAVCAAFTLFTAITNTIIERYTFATVWALYAAAYGLLATLAFNKSYDLESKKYLISALLLLSILLNCLGCYNEMSNFGPAHAAPTVLFMIAVLWALQRYLPNPTIGWMALPVVTFCALLPFWALNALPSIAKHWAYDYPSMQIVSPSWHAISIAIMLSILYRYNQLELAAVDRFNAELEEERSAESRLLANISHEIRNPINGVIGMLKEIKQATTTSQYREISKSADDGLRSSHHLLHIVNEILDYKQLKQGALQIVPDVVDIRSLQTRDIQLWRTMAEEAGCHYHHVRDTDKLPQFVALDAKRYKQVRDNIVSNAIKFGDKGEVTEQLTYKDGVLTLCVTDTGIGMSEQTLNAVFSHFKQADSSKSKIYAGTGLGLAITRELVELMGGSIAITSKLGVGTTAIVKLPAPSVAAPDQTQAAAELMSPGNLQGLNVLCVDDQRINLKVLNKVLLREGVVVHTAQTAVKALSIFADQPIDIVVTDISMPGMSGDELLKALREIAPNLPVIAATGDVLAEDLAALDAAGFDAVLIKPIDQERLLLLLTALSDRAAQPMGIEARQNA